jgi:hypothetical protein
MDEVVKRRQRRNPRAPKVNLQFEADPAVLEQIDRLRDAQERATGERPATSTILRAALREYLATRLAGLP